MAGPAKNLINRKKKREFMEKNKAILSLTLAFSVILELFVRKGAVMLYGANGFALWPWIDNVMHFFWGLNIFLALLFIFKWEPLDALLGLFVWQMVWESIEIIGDHLAPQPAYMFDHFFFDGIKDTILDIAGGFVGWLIFAWKKKDNHPKRFRGWMKKYFVATVILIACGTAYWGYTISEGMSFSSPNVFTVWWLAVTAILTAAPELVKGKVKDKNP